MHHQVPALMGIHPLKLHSHAQLTDLPSPNLHLLPLLPLLGQEKINAQKGDGAGRHALGPQDPLLHYAVHPLLTLLLRHFAAQKLRRRLAGHVLRGRLVLWEAVVLPGHST